MKEVADKKIQYGHFLVKQIVTEHGWHCDMCKKCGCYQSV